MIIEDLAIEITRKCNATCKHCLRGDPQSITIRKEYLDALAQNITQIHRLTISGGEPSLAIPEINYFLERFYNKDKWDPTFSMLYVVTNALENTSDLIAALDPMRDYVTTQLAASNTCMHPEIPPQNLEAIKSCGFGKIGNRQNNMGNSRIIMEGRALNYSDIILNKESAYREHTKPFVWNSTFLGKTGISGVVYVNALGFVVDGSAYSYETQDSGVATLGHVFDFENLFPRGKDMLPPQQISLLDADFPLY